MLFDSLTEKLQCECYILNDLLLSINNTTFQIDSLIIKSDKVYLYEIKNYEGDYYYESDKLFKLPQAEIINPLHQLSRSESLLRQLFRRLGFNPQIDASVVFINPDFTLYQAPLDKPFILPNQLNNYFKKENITHSKLSGQHKLLADKLISLHTAESPFSQLPPYNYQALRKGITCIRCNSFSIFVEGRKCICEECGNEEIVANAVTRSVKEFRLLFPDQKITTNVIHEWCQVVPSKTRIRRILAANFNIVGVHQWAYYE
ncbi:hypothetical protein GCM10027286_11140 [Virgibacillus ainsalahensis]